MTDRFWPERVIIFLGMLLAAALLFLGLTAGNTYDAKWVAVFFEIWFVVASKTLLPIWLVLRFFDLCFISRRRN